MFFCMIKSKESFCSGTRCIDSCTQHWIYQTRFSCLVFVNVNVLFLFNLEPFRYLYYQDLYVLLWKFAFCLYYKFYWRYLSRYVSTIVADCNNLKMFEERVWRYHVSVMDSFCLHITYILCFSADAKYVNLAGSSQHFTWNKCITRNINV